jgi:hypothetical protein
VHQRFRLSRISYNFSEQQKNNEGKESKDSVSQKNEYQKNFEKLQEKISNTKSDSQIKTETVKNIFVNAKRYVDGGIESLFKKKSTAEGAQASNEKTEENLNKDASTNADANVKKTEPSAQKTEKKEEKKEENKDKKQEEVNKESQKKEEEKKDDAKKAAEEPAQNVKVEKKPKMDVLKEKLPRVHKVVSIAKYAWDLTFPDEKYKAKFEKNKAQWAEQKREDERIANLTEEEIKQV